MEFSRPVAIDAIDETGLTLAIEADAGERARLAAALGLVDLRRLKAEATLRAEEGRRLFHLAGTIEADVTQTCVVTLEPLEATIACTLERVFDAEGEAGAEAVEDIDIDAEDPPEPVFGGEIDVGAAIAEQLALELDPFPRKPGAAFAEYAATGPEGAEKGATGPFAALARLKRKLK